MKKGEVSVMGYCSPLMTLGCVPVALLRTFAYRCTQTHGKSCVHKYQHLILTKCIVKWLLLLIGCTIVFILRSVFVLITVVCFIFVWL